MKVCELYDALLVRDIPSDPQRHLSDVMSHLDSINLKGQLHVVGYVQLTLRWLLHSLYKEKVAGSGLARWQEIGLDLGLSHEVLT